MESWVKTQLPVSKLQFSCHSTYLTFSFYTTELSCLSPTATILSLKS